jgi:hypothetical protein
MNTKKLIKTPLLFMILISLIPIQVSAQGHPIGVGGYVHTKDGFPSDNATVTIWNSDTGESVYTTTNILGKYGKAITGESGDLIHVLAKKGSLEGDNSTYVNISNPTQWVNVTIERQQGGGGGTGVPPVENPPLPEPDSPPEIPPPQPPEYPNRPGSVYEMYDLLKIMSLPNSTRKVTVMVIDSGAKPGNFEAFMDPNPLKTVNMSKISLRFNSKYFKSGVDENGHGTFTNYEVAYILQTKCMNAIHISYRVFGSESTSSTDIFLDALKQAEIIKPDVVSISIGAPGRPSDAFAQEVLKLRNMGIIVVVAAGNYGWNKILQKPAPSTITSPGLSEGAICVGAFDYKLTKTFADDIICKWSSRGPVAGVTPPKPDVVAPGESIAGIGLSPYAVSSGTSFACPLIAGGTAVVIANTKDLADQVKALYFWDGGTVPKTFEDALRESCISKGSENDWGSGIPQYDKVLVIFRNKLNMLIIQFIALMVIVSILTVSGAAYYLKKKKATPWYKRAK